MIKSLLPVFLFATAVFAQSIAIRLPIFNQPVERGSNLTVQLVRPDSLTGSQDVAAVLGLQHCPCTPPLDFLGDILYTGPYYPEHHEKYLPPYQNFTVKIPAGFPLGRASIDVAHFMLIAPGYPYLETLNQTITIV